MMEGLKLARARPGSRLASMTVGTKQKRKEECSARGVKLSDTVKKAAEANDLSRYQRMY